MNQLQIFNYLDHEVRTLQIDGEPWWVLKDVCNVLEHSNSRKMALRLDEDEKGVTPIHTPGGTQQMTVVSESGLYNVILRSDKPQAKAFRRWITHEVLPSIRKQGHYGNPTPDQEIYNIGQKVAEIMMEHVSTIISATVKATLEAMGTQAQAPVPVKPAQGFHRRSTGRKIDQLPDELRKEIVNMLLFEKYSYGEVTAYVKSLGYNISETSIWIFVTGIKDNMAATHHS